MSTNPKPQRKPKETPTVAHKTLSFRAAARSLAEYTCCRAGAPGWVCARQGRLRSGPSHVEGASPSLKIGAPLANPGENQDTPGPYTGMRDSAGQDGSCPPEVPVPLGAPMTPGIGRATWVRSSIP
ncbi:protein F [Hepatitis C virus genotype 2]|uniref:protein F n=1 Tax=Hepatitis C virus genotype 2 TaxID=40271 RepID=UPI00083BA535|nr:protein F [Hepatitis C virus genotype 2]